ncbi:hypothetical protein TCAL_05171 [Tigriopus californicus]|uniref:RAP domain-containing protein n=1 Tax=Tigriopus californicus TaxID=6832 RepID=A0A553NPE0_TIGCA|nr:uncharacterized protein LOC131879120 [Tigriopus californicus]TRY67293.1 hypothetical protein TCAL_05171 [Tigriopus californicus]|eukprot:TCALIF_05171-PA protein Name:"Protein of unknown function" AED:0.00 eAED:0.00 QI:133/1/0.83/1/0.8/0.83/6/130/694
MPMIMWSMGCVRRHWRLLRLPTSYRSALRYGLPRLLSVPAHPSGHLCAVPSYSPANIASSFEGRFISTTHAHPAHRSESALLQFRTSRDVLDSILKTLSQTQSGSYPYFPVTVSDPSPTVTYVQRVIAESDQVDDKDEMVALVQAIVQAEQQPACPDVEQRCLDKFQSWVGKTKLGIGFLLYQSDNLKSGEFLTRVVAHLGQNLNALNTPEFVTFMLMIHFRRPWSLAELVEVCNPSLMHEKFAKLLELKHLSPAEICACCLGFRRVQDFQVTNTELRLSLYETLCRFATRKPLDAMDQLVILHLCLLINQGRGSLSDNPEMVAYTLSCFRNAIQLLDLETSSKVMTLGMLNGVHDELVTDQVLQRVIHDPSHLSLRSSVTLLNFLIRVGTEDLSSLKAIQNRVLSCVQNVTQPTFQDLADTWSSLLLCSLPLVIDESYFRDTLSPLSELVYSNQNYHEMSDQVITVLFKSTFHGRSTINIAEVNSTPVKKTKFIKGIVRLLGILQIDRPDLYESLNLDPSCIECLFVHFREPVPAAVTSDTENLNNLSPILRFLARRRRDLNQIMGFESACDIVSVIPLFTNPMVVFGHVAGNSMCAEAYLEPDRFGYYRAPDVGEWVVLIPKRSKATGTMDWYWEVMVRHLHLLGFEVAEFGSLKETTRAVELVKSILIGHFPRPFLPKEFRQTPVVKSSDK